GSGRCVSDFRFGAPQLNEPPAPVRSLLRVCIPRRRDSIITFEELDKLEAMTTPRRTKCLCDAEPEPIVFVRRSTISPSGLHRSFLGNAVVNEQTRQIEHSREPGDDGNHVKRLDDRNRHSQKFYRIINEIPAILMAVIVILAVVKPF